MIDPERDPHHHIRIFDIVPAIRPRPHPRPPARLVRILAARVKLAVAVFGDVDIVVGELCALVMEAVGVGEHFLKGRGVDFVGDGFAVDGIEDGGVLDLERAVGVEVDVDAAGFFDHGFVDHVAGSLRVEGRARHGVCFVVDEAVGVAVDGRVHAE